MQDLINWITKNKDVSVTVSFSSLGMVCIGMSSLDYPEKGMLNGVLEDGKTVEEKLNQMKEQLLFDEVIDSDDIWAVSYIDLENEMGHIVGFDNKKAAEKYFAYAERKFKYVTIENLEILSDFTR